MIRTVDARALDILFREALTCRFPFPRRRGEGG